MSKLDDWEKDVQTGKFSVVAAILTGILTGIASIGAIGKKTLDKSMKDAAYERSLKDYENLPFFLNLFKKKPKR